MTDATDADLVAERRRRRRFNWVAGLLAAVLAGATIRVIWSAVVGDRPKAICLSNISQLAKAMRLYSLDYNCYMFFDEGEAFSKPLVAGHYGQNHYLKQAMKSYVPNWEIWYCPADRYAKRDFTCNTVSFGSFNYTASGFGYRALDHRRDRDPGIARLRADLRRRYGQDDMRVDHAVTSYRFIPSMPGEERPADPDAMYRVYRRDRGADGYWDIYPKSAWVFEEDLPFHFRGKGLFRRGIYGRTCGFRDGHARFRTGDGRGVNLYGELIEWGPGGEEAFWDF